VLIVIVIVIVIVIGWTFDVLETGVSCGRAIDRWLGAHGSARMVVEFVGRPPGHGSVEVWPPVRSRPEPLLRTWRSGSARRGVDWRDDELPDRPIDLTDIAGSRVPLTVNRTDISGRLD
jgi:hypothetical protein